MAYRPNFLASLYRSAERKAQTAGVEAGDVIQGRFGTRIRVTWWNHAHCAGLVRSGDWWVVR